MGNTRRQLKAMLVSCILVFTTLVSPLGYSTGLAQAEGPIEARPLPQVMPGPRAETADSLQAGAVAAGPQDRANVREMPSAPLPPLPEQLPSDGATAPAGAETIPSRLLQAPAALPNLTPYKPTGWADAVVLSGSTGSFTQGTLQAGANTYVDVSVANFDVSLSGSYYAYLYLDGVYVAYFTFTNHVANTYQYYADFLLPVKPAAGWHYIQLWIDPVNAVAESNESDNLYSKYFYWADNTQGPNLTPYQVKGWSNAIVLDSKAGTTSDGPLYADIATYFDVAFANLGTTNAAAFNTCLYVDNARLQCWRVSQAANYYQSYTDFSAVVSAAGWHDVTLRVDVDNEIAETNELDNTLTVRYLWESSSRPNLRPSPYTGWSAAIVPAMLKGTSQKDALRAGVPSYVDWSVVNDGKAPVPAVNFVTGLYLDGKLMQSWTQSTGLPSGYYLLVQDYPYTFSVGWHTLELRADTTNVVQEANEMDNSLALRFYWDGQSTQPDIRVEPARVDIKVGAGGLQTQAAASLVPPVLTGERIDFSQYGTGAAPDYSMPMIREMIPLAPAAPEELPARVDLSSKLPPVRHQGRSNSCVGWASGYYMKSLQESIDQGWAPNTPQRQFSPNYIWNQIKKGNCGGSSLADAHRVLKSQGVVPLSSWPFSPDCAQQPTQTLRDQAANYRSQDWDTFFKVESRIYLTDQVIQEMKEWLSAGEPIMLALHIAPEFDRASRAPNCTVDLPNQGPSRGLHAVTIVGYDENIANTGKRGFKVVNSWGEKEWGCGGFAYLTYNWLKIYATEATWMRDIRTGGYYTRDFTIFNDGNATLVINGVTKQGGAKWLQMVLPEALPITLEPGEAGTVELTVNSQELSGSALSETIRVTSNDPDEQVVSVQVNLQTGVAGGAPPNLPTDPNPAHAAIHQPSSALKLRWQASDPDTSAGLLYDVRLEAVDPPSKIVCNDVLQPECTVTGLLPDTTYYWRVIANDGVTPSLGPVWSFTTGGGDAKVYLPFVRR